MVRHARELLMDFNVLLLLGPRWVITVEMVIVGIFEGTLMERGAYPIRTMGWFNLELKAVAWGEATFLWWGSLLQFPPMCVFCNVMPIEGMLER